MAGTIKSEFTVARGGLQTPSQSVTLSTESPSIKIEIDLTDTDEEDPATSIPSNPSPLTEKDSYHEGRSSPPGIPSRDSTTSPTPRAPVRLRKNSASPLRMESGLEVVGRNVKKLVSTIDQLKRIGLKSVDAQLPELVLVGDQSAGKSSLMGAIAEINLPKGQSMCTRCPTNIRTSSADQWSCVISLEKSYNFEAHKAQRKAQEFPHWSENEEREIIPFMEIKDKTELEQALRCAQTAILNPSQDPQIFVPTNFSPSRQSTEVDEARFSPIVIAVAIAGPGLPDLSFYDLPGLFQAAEADEQKYLIKVFDNLTAKYIKHENALIICAITMQNDPGVSKAKGFVGNSKADKRCIGVLTMPDRMQNETAHKDYTNILDNKAYVLKPHGYFVTKQPGPKSLARGPLYHETARKEEKIFFETSGLWGPGGEWNRFHHRCGTETIQEYLSKVFAQQILNSLPDITKSIEQQTLEVDRGLANLPDAPKDKIQHLVRMALGTFSNQVRMFIDPSSLSAFQSEWNKLCGQFLQALDTMRPGCVCKGEDIEIIDLDDSDDDDDEDAKSTISSLKRGLEFRDISASASPNKRLNNSPGAAEFQQVVTPRNIKPKPEEPRSGLRAFRPMLIPAMNSMMRKVKKSELGPFYQPYLAAGSGAMSLMGLRTAIGNNACAERPTETNFNVKRDISLTAITSWKEPLMTFIECAFQNVRQEILATLATSLAKYEKTSLFHESRSIIEKFLDIKEEEQRKNTLRYFDVERSRIFTVCVKELKRHQADALALLTANRQKHRIDAYVEKQARLTGRVKEESRARSEAESNLGPDSFAEELRTAAFIRGYYNTARTRFVNSVCADINAHYFHTISEQVQYLLEKELGIDEGDSETKCQSLTEDNPEISHQRNALQKRKQQLNKFSAILNQLQEDIGRENDKRADGHERLLQSGLTGSSTSNDDTMSFDDEEVPADPTPSRSKSSRPDKDRGY